MKKLLTIIIVTIISLIGITSVNAAEITYTGQFRLQYYSLSNGDSALTTVGNFNTGQTLSSGYGVSKVIARYTSTFTTGTIYRISTIVGFAPSEITSSFRVVDSIGCFGTTSSSNWNADASLVTCEIVGVSQIPNTNRIKYIVDITPVSNVAGIQFNINYGVTEEVRTVNVYTASTITTGPDIAGSIDEQTAAIEQGFQDISDQITQANEELINSITEQNQVCEIYDKVNIKIDNKMLLNNGTEYGNNNFGITEYIKTSKKDIIKALRNAGNTNGTYYCFYNINKEVISCENNNTITINTAITIPDNTSYVRFTIYKETNVPQWQICKNGNQALIDQDHNYTTDDSINNALDEEETLTQTIDQMIGFEEIDFDINLDSTTSSFIWNIFDELFMWGYIEILIMGLLSIGIIKMVLNR